VITYPNWFACYADTFFAHHLTPLAGRPGLRFLQIGAFTGDASLWLFEHILTGPGATLVDVDTWEGSDEPAHDAFDFADVERVYDERTSGLVESGRLHKFKGTSLSFFQNTGALYLYDFDFIYIDGDHTAFNVLVDAVCAYPLLKVGGLIAFDDYLWKSGKGWRHDPGPAIDVVADLYSDRLERLDNPQFPGEGPLQVWFRKIR
jgi:predicted O-methyltransferase YrrM